MIKAAVVGADSRIAGELIRILTGHPDVEMVCLYAPSLSGHPVSETHHGLIGAGKLVFTDRFDASVCDIVFAADDSDFGKSVVASLDGDNPRLVVIGNVCSRIAPPAGIEYGLSEINRKALVRGASRAVVPSLPASAALIALYPLASNLLLGSDIHIKALCDGCLAAVSNPSVSAMEISRRLSLVQASFDGNVSLDVDAGGAPRQFSLQMTIRCALPMEEILKLYDSIYDDHNFTYVVTYPVDYREVAGTDRCIVSLSKSDEDSLRISVEVDAALRGGAGEAVHLMNLLFGLHEKTGLDLKASTF